jgi:hypothetical protein
MAFHEQGRRAAEKMQKAMDEVACPRLVVQRLS